MSIKIFYKSISYVFILLFPLLGLAHHVPGSAPLSKITMQLQVEGWAATSSANVSVDIDATLDKNSAMEVRNQIMGKLTKISKVDWHIVRFNQGQNASGLEQLTASAEGRLPESALSSLRESAKNISQPGLSFKIANIDFVPTTDELEAAKADLRNKIYAQAKAEVGRLNVAYPELKYMLHNIEFNPALVGNSGEPMMAKMAHGVVPISVNNKITMAATVEIASLPAVVPASSK